MAWAWEGRFCFDPRKLVLGSVGVVLLGPRSVRTERQLAIKVWEDRTGKPKRKRPFGGVFDSDTHTHTPMSRAQVDRRKNLQAVQVDETSRAVVLLRCASI